MKLAETDGLIHQLAQKVWDASSKDARVARTVVLKLKTSDFTILTRSLTPRVPPQGGKELASIALSLRARIDTNESLRFRLVGVGLSNFVDAERTCISLFDIE